MAGVVLGIAWSDHESLERPSRRVIGRGYRGAGRREPVPRQGVRRLPYLIAPLPHHLDRAVVVGGEDFQRFARWVMHRCRWQGVHWSGPVSRSEMPTSWTPGSALRVTSELDASPFRRRRPISKNEHPLKHCVRISRAAKNQCVESSVAKAGPAPVPGHARGVPLGGLPGPDRLSPG